MTESTDLAVQEADKTAVASLKISRNDLIEIVVKDVLERHKKDLKKACGVKDAALLAYVEAVNVSANRKAKPAIDALIKVASSETAVRAAYRYEVSTYSSTKQWRHEMEALPENVIVRMCDGYNGHYYDKTTFRVEIRLTAPLRKLREKAHQAVRDYGELQSKDTTLTGMRGIVRQKLLHQSVLNSPEGRDVLAALDALRKQVESNTGEAILS